MANLQAEKCRQMMATTSYNRKWHTDAENGYVANSGCRSLSQLPADTVFELAVVDNPGYAIRISMVSVLVTETLAFPVLRTLCYFRLTVDIIFTW